MSHSTGGSRSFSRAIFAGIMLALICLPGMAFAQSEASAGSGSNSWTGSETMKSPDESWKTRAVTGFEYQGDTDLDSGGDFNYWMVSGGVRSGRKIGDKMQVMVVGEYRAIGYDFSGVPNGGGGTVNPWETVHVARLMPLFSYLLNDRWSVVGGPVVEFSGEGGAQVGDSIRGGGVAGFGYQREGLYLVFGVLAMTEIEKDARIQPFVLVDWRITDGLSLGLKAETSRGGELRLDYGFTKNFKMGAGIGVRRELFRLNGDNRVGAAGNAQDGVGEETSTVAKVTASYQINETIAIEGYGGLTLDGEFRLETETGNKIGSSDYDNSGFGGVNLRFNF